MQVPQAGSGFVLLAPSMNSRPIEPRHDISDEDEDLVSAASAENVQDEESEETNPDGDDELVDTDPSEDSTEATSGDGTNSDSDSDDPEELGGSLRTSLKDVSFGTLAGVAESIQPKSRKRKVPDDFDTEPEQRHGEAHVSDTKTSSKQQHRPPPTRQSKHAPTILSSKQQVSRKRNVFEPSPSAKSRDPRFDPTIQSSQSNSSAIDKANKNYSFLSSYQATEILELKSQLKKTKDPDTVAELKRQVMSFENKMRATEAKQRQRDVVKQHKQKEKEAIRTGQKSRPYYLKDSEVKKMANEEKMQGMSKKAKDKAERNRLKRQKAKEARIMPRQRRE